MIIPNFQKIITSDFDSKYDDLIPKLAYSLNNFADNITNALNKNLTIQDNFRYNIMSVTVTVDSNGVPTSQTQFQTSLSVNTSGLQVIKAVNNSTLLSGSITNISASPLTTITAPGHSLKTGNQIIISGSNSNPIIDGTWTVGVIDKNTFSIPFSVTSAGSKGTYKLANYPTSTPFITYTESNGLITITNVTNLPANQNFTLTIIIYT